LTYLIGAGPVGCHSDKEAGNYDPLLVRRVEYFGDLSCDEQCLVEWNRTTRDSLRELCALDQLHDDEHRPALPVPLLLPVEPVNVRNVGMIE